MNRILPTATDAMPIRDWHRRVDFLVDDIRNILDEVTTDLAQHPDHDEVLDQFRASVGIGLGSLIVARRNIALVTGDDPSEYSEPWLGDAS